MPRAGRRAQVIISPKDFRRRMQKILKVDYAKFYDRFVDKISEEAVRVMKTKVPIRSGTLRNSIRIKSKQRKGGGADRRANVEIGPTVFYASYVDEGTQPSSGRFVPELGRRIATGIHPGIRAQHFTEATARAIEPKVNDFYKQFEITPLKRKWRSAIKPRGRG